MLTPEEKEKILFSFNSTTTEFPGATTYSELFNQQVLTNPKQIAVVFEDREISYSELDSESNKIANHLISRGLHKESLIGICLDRSAEMITGILGILKAGAAYMPIDP